MASSEQQHHVAGTLDPCACGVCGSDVPPLIGSVLTGAGLTLDQAAARLEADVPLPPLTDVQLRLVEERAEQRIAAGH